MYVYVYIVLENLGKGVGRILIEKPLHPISLSFSSSQSFSYFHFFQSYGKKRKPLSFLRDYSASLFVYYALCSRTFFSPSLALECSSYFPSIYPLVSYLFIPLEIESMDYYLYQIPNREDRKRKDGQDQLSGFFFFLPLSLLLKIRAESY